MSFNKLYQSSVALTEILRSGTLEGTDALFAKVTEDYNPIVETVKKMMFKLGITMSPFNTRNKLFVNDC